MGNVPAPQIVWRGANPNNFTVGRPGGGRDGRNTFHHVVGSAESAVLVFNNPSRGASSHFVITDQDNVIFQCVDINNTAWTDGNWESNLRTVSMEHHGDWRGGYDNPTVRENSARLVAWLRDQGIVSRPIRHRDVATNGTICPADLPVEAIWNRATEIINQYNNPTPPPQPQWLQNRQEIAGKQVYAQSEGIFIVNLNDGNSAADSRRFVLNQNFEVAGQTTVDGKEFYITRSSMNANLANGILKSQVADAPYVAPAPTPEPTPTPQPTTPSWHDSVIDDENRELYVLRATQLINLESGRPVMKDGKEVWYSAGDIIKDASAHTVVAGVTYTLTEYSYAQVKNGKPGIANGIKSSDLTIDPKATPEGTPANPDVTEPEDPVTPMPDVPTPTTPSKDDEQDARLTAIEAIIKAIVEFFKGLAGGITKK